MVNLADSVVARAARRVRLFGIDVDAARLEEAASQLLDWVREPAELCRYVVTPNVDHTVILQEREDLQAAYRDASLVLADGQPIVWASRLLGRSLPERVAGSDLTPAMFDLYQRRFDQGHAATPLRVFLLGAAPGVAQRAAQVIHSCWPAVQIVGTHSPPVGFDKNDQENEQILSRLVESAPDVLVVGLGAPKQELWVHAHRRRLPACVVLCVGATIDFLAGGKARAPRWMRQAGLEWLHRMASEPRRLARRYLRDACVFPQLVWRERRCRWPR